MSHVPEHGPELTEYIAARNPSYTPQVDKSDQEQAFLKEKLGINDLVARVEALETQLNSPADELTLDLD